MQHRGFAMIAIVLAFVGYGFDALAGVSCADLALQPYGGAKITAASPVPAGGNMPGFFRITATAGLQTDIEVRLPDNWQKRFLHLGGGGFDGGIPNLNPLSAQLKQGYALAASNGGHRAKEYPGATFGKDFTLTEDYAYTSIGTTVRVAKALIAAYYGERPKYSYWAGCSNGGRGGFNAAAKYTLEYDGVRPG